MRSLTNHYANAALTYYSTIGSYIEIGISDNPKVLNRSKSTVILACLKANVARVFLLREVDDLESDAICEMMKITPSNLWVMLHRARLALRRCLEVNWIGRQKEH